MDRAAGWYDQKRHQAILNASMNAAVDVGDRPSKYQFTNKYTGLPQHVEYSDFMECQSSMSNIKQINAVSKMNIAKVFGKK